MKKAILISLLILTFSYSVAAAEGWILWLEIREGSTTWKINSAHPTYEKCIGEAFATPKSIAQILKPGMEITDELRIDAVVVTGSTMTITYKTSSGKLKHSVHTYKCLPSDFDPRK
jgi:hypothetical protein